MSYKIINFVYYALIILIVIFITYTIYYMVSNKEAFTENPFVYGASKMKGDIYCSCQQNIEGRIYQFAFNKTNWWNIPTKQFILP